jgi:hypothetical protein
VQYYPPDAEDDPLVEEVAVSPDAVLFWGRAQKSSRSRVVCDRSDAQTQALVFGMSTQPNLKTCRSARHLEFRDF